jgi:hypothetical protein
LLGEIRVGSSAEDIISLAETLDSPAIPGETTRAGNPRQRLGPENGATRPFISAFAKVDAWRFTARWRLGRQGASISAAVSPMTTI